MSRIFFSFLSAVFVISGSPACFASPVLNSDGNPVVDVPQGRIIGLEETNNNIPMLVYRSIPFAEPPVNELRFMPPIPAGPWTGDLDASQKPHSCVQIGATGRENCLYLNVYTPYDAIYTNSTVEPMPVMVYIHGGAFVVGSASTYDGTYPLVQHGVIVVLIQYRLGVLGFFSTDDNVMPGNQGLKDQTLAIKWVNDNIGAFGGDASRITIFGESAGSVSTHFHLLSPYSQGLYQNAILMSGSGLVPWGVGRDFYNTSQTIARRFNCSQENSTEMITCLQDVNYLLLNNMLIFLPEWNGQPFFFGPRVDGDFIPDEPARLVKEGRYNKVPCIMGMTRDEGALESGELYAKPFLLDSLMESFTVNSPISLQLYEDEDPVNTADTAYNYYLGGTEVTEDNADNFTKFLTDRLFHTALDWLVQQQADQSEVYMYQFDYRGQYAFMDAYTNIGLNLTASEDWICHGDDIFYAFQVPRATGPEENLNDMTIRTIYTKLFTNFAKYGTPTPDETFLGFLWPATTSSDLQHISIAIPTVMEGDTRQTIRAFWESLPLRINAILQG